MAAHKPIKTGLKIASAAIDLGTTYSGWALSFTHDQSNVQMGKWSKGGTLYDKTSTCALICADGQTLEAFGFEAEQRYIDLVDENRHEEFYFFKNFKMCLYKQRDCLGLKLNGADGRSLPALTVFSLAIGYLKDDLLRTCSKQLDHELIEDDVTWVVTIPAIWTDDNKRFMRAAATKAGIHTDDLRLALEPEVAAIYSRNIRFRMTGTQQAREIDQLSTFQAGDKFLVVDAGGGTVDITVNLVEGKDKLSELRTASGGPWGGKVVNQAFRDFLVRVFSRTVIDAINVNCTEEYEDLLQNFEISKRSIGEKDNKPMKIKLPSPFFDYYSKMTGNDISLAIERFPGISLTKDKLTIGYEQCKAMFGKAMEPLLNHLKGLFKTEALLGVTKLLLVGGFSESPLLQSEIKAAFPEFKVIVPSMAGTSVLRGAAMYGHELQDPIISRKSKFTYGIAATCTENVDKYPKDRQNIDHHGEVSVDKTFHKLVGIGETCSELKPCNTTCFTLDPHTSDFWLELYASESPEPLFVDDQECFKLGDIKLTDCKSYIRGNAKVEVSLYVGGTEVLITATNTLTGRQTSARFSTEYTTVL